jgi:hypothetical protein
VYQNGGFKFSFSVSSKQLLWPQRAGAADAGFSNLYFSATEFFSPFTLDRPLFEGATGEHLF